MQLWVEGWFGEQKKENYRKAETIAVSSRLWSTQKKTFMQKFLKNREKSHKSKIFFLLVQLAVTNMIWKANEQNWAKIEK